MDRPAFYARVSSQDQLDGYSIDAQERARDTFAAARGWTNVRTYRDEGHSAFRESLQRPALQRLLTDVRAGLINIVFVHKLDRFSRRLGVTYDLIEEFGRRNVSFVSITENIDLTTPFGWAAFQMQSVWAELYSRNLSREVNKGLREKAAQGQWVGVIPLGYDRIKGRLVPNDDAAIVRQIYTLYLSSDHSAGDIARVLNRQSLRPQRKRGSFNREHVLRILRSQVYLGTVTCEDIVVPDAHEPIITPDEHRAAQRIIEQRSGWRGSRVKRDDAVLAGIVWCHTCGAKVHVQRPNKAYFYLKCSASRDDDCPERSMPGALAELQINALIDGIRLSGAFMRDAIALARKELEADTQRPVDTTLLQERGRRLTRAYMDGLIDDSEYEAQRAALQADLAAIEEAQQAPTEYDLEYGVRMIESLNTAMDFAGVSEQRNVVFALFDRVWIAGRRIVAVNARSEVYPLIKPLDIGPLIRLHSSRYPLLQSFPPIVVQPSGYRPRGVSL